MYNRQQFFKPSSSSVLQLLNTTRNPTNFKATVIHTAERPKFKHKPTSLRNVDPDNPNN